MSAEVIQFKGKEAADKAASEIMSAAERQTDGVVKQIDNDLELEKTLPDVSDEEEVVATLEELEVSMLRQTIMISKRIKEDKKLYEKNVEDNLRGLLKDPKAISAYLLEKAIYDDVDREVVIRIAKNKQLMDVLRKTMFWRIQERINLFDFNLSIRKGFKVVKTDPVHIKDMEEAAEMLSKMKFMDEIKGSNHPMARMLRDYLKDL